MCKECTNCKVNLRCRGAHLEDTLDHVLECVDARHAVACKRHHNLSDPTTPKHIRQRENSDQARYIGSSVKFIWTLKGLAKVLDKDGYAPQIYLPNSQC